MRSPSSFIGRLCLLGYMEKSSIRKALDTNWWLQNPSKIEQLTSWPSIKDPGIWSDAKIRTFKSSRGSRCSVIQLPWCAYVLFSGTSTLSAWLDNINMMTPVSCPKEWKVSDKCKVHSGFLDLYKHKDYDVVQLIGILSGSKPSGRLHRKTNSELYEQLIPFLKSLTFSGYPKVYRTKYFTTPEHRGFVFIGHSAGGDLAQLSAVHMSSAQNKYPIRVCTMGTPACGNREWCRELLKRCTVEQFITTGDVFPFLVPEITTFIQPLKRPVITPKVYTNNIISKLHPDHPGLTIVRHATCGDVFVLWYVERLYAKDTVALAWKMLTE